MKIKITPVIYIVLTSSLIGLIINSISPNGIPLLKAERKINFIEDSINVDGLTEVITESNMQNNTFREAKAITLKQAYSLFNQDVLFIDARDYVEYEKVYGF